MRHTTGARARPHQVFVTRLQLADVFDVDGRTIHKFIEDGLPVALRGAGGKASKFDVQACVRWFLERRTVERGPDGEAGGVLVPQLEKALLDRRRREALELQLAVRRRELVPHEVVAREFADCASHVKDRLRRIPSAVADQVVTCEGAAAVQAFLLGAIDDALRELAANAEEGAATT